MAVCRAGDSRPQAGVGRGRPPASELPGPARWRGVRAPRPAVRPGGRSRRRRCIDLSPSARGGPQRPMPTSRPGGTRRRRSPVGRRPDRGAACHSGERDDRRVRHGRYRRRRSGRGGHGDVLVDGGGVRPARREAQGDSDAVLQAPEIGVPVLMVQLDRSTMPPTGVIQKLAMYRDLFVAGSATAPRPGLGRQRRSAPWRGRRRRIPGHTRESCAYRAGRHRAGPIGLQNRLEAVANLPADYWQGQLLHTSRATKSPTTGATTCTPSRSSPPPWSA